MRFIPMQSKPISLLAAALFGIGFTAACSPSANNGGSGGTNSSSGGNHGSGGNSTGSGGNKGSGGTTGSGGNSSTGSGGSSTGSGGKVGSGGSTGSGGSSTGSGGKGSGGSTTTGSGGSMSSGSGGSSTGSGGSTTTGSGGGTTTGSGGATTGSGGSTGGGGQGGSIAGCMNTDMSTINIDSSGYICNNQWGIKGAWYCYSSDSSHPCNKTGAIPYNATSKGMCMSGTQTSSGTVLMGFKVNSGPPGDSATPGKWDASKLVGFAITVAPGASNKGSAGSVLYVQYPTSTNVTSKGDAPGITVPGVAGTPMTYNTLFSDALLANNVTDLKSVDPANLTDVKVALPTDTPSLSYDFCITKVEPLMAAPSPVVAAGSYGPAWTNQTGQAVNGINGYAVQNAPFSMSGLPMTMQVKATATGVGFTYMAKQGASGNSPAAFPAVVSGWGIGSAGIQFYGPYKGGKTIGQLTSVKSTWSYTMGSSGDAVYDVWFGNSAQPLKAQTELMIWIGNKDKDPLKDGSSAAGAAVGGRTPYVAANNGTGQQVVSYWIEKGTVGTASNLELLDYFKDAANNKYAGLSSGSFLLGVQTGFEVYSGSGDTWTTTDYNITIQ